jgi:hypothetical protein
MNERDGELFETELRKLRPAKAPDEFVARLAASPAFQRTNLAPELAGNTARPEPDGKRNADRVFAPKRRRGIFSRIGAPWRLPGWLAATAAAGLMFTLLAWLAIDPKSPLVAHRLGGASQPMLTADKVEIGQDLVATFDAVARLPNGRPVRFRCREWSDQMMVSDSARGVVIEERTPRLEIVPVRFETY